MQDQGAPVIGNRYDGDLDPAITRTQLEQVEAAVKGMEGVENAYVNMPTATLRVYADIANDANGEAAVAKANEIYATVASLLDPNVYFTQSGGKKMYDLEIHVYNFVKEPETRKYSEIVANPVEDGYVYVIETKSSNMAEPQAQVVSSPKNAELAAQLRADAAAREAAEEAKKNGEPTPDSGEVDVTDGEEEGEGEDIDTGEEGGEPAGEADTGQGD